MATFQSYRSKAWSAVTNPASNLFDNGSEVIGTNTPRTGKRYKIICVNSDCTISALTLTSNSGTNIDGRVLMGLVFAGASVTMKQGNEIPIPKGYYVSSITVATGSIIAYK